ncbi:MAG: D-alanine--D-alanine ligase [Alphaproteobacteria bacterium]|nr:D-alanine--D-alanine ligase [Alphaproteobacteria bacterium]MBV8549372.1 D-alanine--D-alanine ligase [Alphaproteobacteria bacterium]
MSATQRKKILVMFGGRSPEHDVSIITGLQALSAFDPTLFEAIPLYVAPDGAWLTGEALRHRNSYMLDNVTRGALTEVVLDLSCPRQPQLITRRTSFFGRTKTIPFDVAFLAFHGAIGEDGAVQGLFETAHVPYTGARVLASSAFMDKAATKRVLAGLDVPVLPFWEIRRPTEGTLITPDELRKLLPDVSFPCCIKPAHMGSSIGVSMVKSYEEVSDVLTASIFRYDDTALLEPFVDNLVEYNVAVCRRGGRVITSAIECPKRTNALLDFKTKYVGGNGTKAGTKTDGSKTPGCASEGMLSLTRTINPELPAETEANIRRWATMVFDSVACAGAPRLDFLCNGATGQVWFNEANTIPGSFGYFLWEASRENPMLFSELLEHLVQEALMHHAAWPIYADPTPQDARLLPRR